MNRKTNCQFLVLENKHLGAAVSILKGNGRPYGLVRFVQVVFFLNLFLHLLSNNQLINQAALSIYENTVCGHVLEV